MPFRSYSRDQDWLLPPTLGELIPAEHAVRFVAEFVDMLDLDTVGIKSQPSLDGAPRYSPKLLLAVWLYGFMVRVRSSRKLEAACREIIPFMWLSGGQQPDHSTLARFYQEHRDATRQLLKQTVQLAMEVGLVDFALQAVDGSRVAVANYGSLCSQPTLERLLAQLEQEISAMEASQETEASETSGHALLGKQDRRKRLEEALQALKAQADAIAAGTQRKPKTPRGKRGKGSSDAEAPPRPAASPTDPEATVQKGRHELLVGYNGQAVVDSRAQIVVAADVVTAASDSGQLLPMLEEAQDMTGRTAEALVADAGYFKIADISQAESQGIALYVNDPRDGRADGPTHNPYHKDHFVYDPASDCFTCPEGQQLRHTGQTHWGGQLAEIYTAIDCSHCPARASGACTTAKKRKLAIFGHEEQMRAFANKMHSEPARQILSRRKAVVEPVFAVLREHLGLTRFLLRGLDNVRGEWRLLCTAHNLRKLWRYWWRPKQLCGAAIT